MAVMDGPPGPSGAPIDVGPTDGGSTGGSMFSPKMLLIIGGGLIAVILIYKWWTNNNSSNSAGVATDGTLNTNPAGTDQASTGTSNPPQYNIYVQQPAAPVNTTQGTAKPKPNPKKVPTTKPKKVPVTKHPTNTGVVGPHTSINKNITSSDAVSGHSGKIAPSSSPTPSAGTTRSA